MVTLDATLPGAGLGLPHDASVADVRARYAALIKQFRPDTHPEDFARIRESYEHALQRARAREAQPALRDDADVADADIADDDADTAGPTPPSPAAAAPPAAAAAPQADAAPQRLPLPALLPALQAQVEAQGEAAALPALRRMLDDSRRRGPG
jgi:curved DNA-binding protein CbpA